MEFYTRVIAHLNLLFKIFEIWDFSDSNALKFEYIKNNIIYEWTELEPGDFDFHYEEHSYPPLSTSWLVEHQEFKNQ